MIEVRVRHPIDMEMTPENWAASVYKQLIAAGVPASEDGTITSGSIMRCNDPEDWGVTIYRWQPDRDSE